VPMKCMHLEYAIRWPLMSDNFYFISITAHISVGVNRKLLSTGMLMEKAGHLLSIKDQCVSGHC